MRLSEPAMPSFGRLAETCLEHTDWPGEIDLQPRSLATLFSKLDREIDLDWLRDRVDVQRVICRVLGRPLGDLRVALGEGPTLLHGRRLRLSDARFARELDLARDALPPGIPERACSPGSWGRAQWVAPPGAGKSLVGAWLNVRGLAQVVDIRDVAGWQRLPSSGALYVEVGRGVVVPNLTREELLARPAPICLATADPGPVPGFDSFQSPAIDSYLHALVEWLAARFDGSGHFVPARAETWLRQVALPHRAVVGFGEVLGLLGALDEFTPQSLRGKSLDDLASSFVERRLGSALLDTSWGPATSTQAFTALGHAAARCLVEPGLDLAAPRTLEVWADLLAISREAPDEEWLVRAMRLADDEGRRQGQVERTLRRLPPSGYRMARSLSLGGLLIAPTGGDTRADAEMSLHPRWLVSLLSARAYATALEMSPSEWGAALLDADKRGDLEAALRARFLRGHFAAVEALVDQLDLEEPAHLAALDACLRQLADVTLLGESLADDLAADLLHATCDALLLIDGRLSPTLGLDGPGAHRAALAALSREHPLGARELDPHRTESRRLRAQVAADCAAVAVTKETELALEWLALARDLHADTELPLPPILRLAESLQAGGVLPPAEDAPGGHARGRAVELALCFAAAQGGDVAFEAAWQLLSRQQRESLSDPAILHKLWLRVPTALLPGLFASGEAILFASLLPHHYVAWLEGPSRLPAAAAAHCPLEAVHEAVARRGPGCLQPTALAAFLERSPRLARLLVEQMGQDLHDTDQTLLEALPEPALSRLLEALPADEHLLLWRRPALDRVRSLLLTRIGRLGPGVERAILRLRGLEMALRPLRR
jgi:hypothetical protein